MADRKSESSPGHLSWDDYESTDTRTPDTPEQPDFFSDGRFLQQRRIPPPLRVLARQRGEYDGIFDIVIAWSPLSNGGMRG